MLLLSLFLFSAAVSLARGQECPEIQESELGDLISDAVTLGDSGSAPAITVLDSQTVCLAVGPTRDRYRYASVVVSFSCSGSLPPGNPLGVTTCNGELTAQFDFECVSGPQWQRALTLGGDNVFNPSDGSLTTSLRRDCSFCVDPAVDLGVPVDMETHCADCDASCTGLMKCTGIPDSFCCNYYASDTCTLMCTDPLVPGANNTCVIDCGSLSDPTDGQVTFTATTEDSVANYTCDTGYDLVGDTTRTCQSDGQWSGSEPTCQIVDCGSGDLNNPTDGQVNFKATTFNSTATYDCNTGYNLQGVATRTCQADGIWSDSEPTCQIVACGNGTLNDSTDGQVSFTTTTFNSTATYSCNTGYNLQGVATRTCQANGTWSDSEPTCQIVDCGNGTLNNPTDGQVSFTTTAFSSTATYDCNTGYNLQGEATRTCQANGTWSDSEPTCQSVNCGTLSDLTNGIISYSSGTTYESIAIYSCNTGYIIQGTSTRRCQADRTWDGSKPNCQIVDCGALTDPMNGEVDFTTTTYGSSATYSCNTGYTLVGGSVRTCQESGGWSGSAPTCAQCDDEFCKNCDSGRPNVCQECVKGYTIDRAGASCVVSEEDDGLDLAALLGIILGCIAAVILLLILVVVCIVVGVCLKKDNPKTKTKAFQAEIFNRFGNVVQNPFYVSSHDAENFDSDFAPKGFGVGMMAIPEGREDEKDGESVSEVLPTQIDDDIGDGVSLVASDRDDTI